MVRPLKFRHNVLLVATSNAHLYARVVQRKDPWDTGSVVAKVVTTDKAVRSALPTPSTKDHNACLHIGQLLATEAKKAGLVKVYFEPQRGQKVTGNLKILIDSACAAGLYVKQLRKASNIRPAYWKYALPREYDLNGNPIVPQSSSTGGELEQLPASQRAA